MKTHSKIALIAPCGMNCSLCTAYQRDMNKCPGCRGSDTNKPITRWKCKVKTCSIFQDIKKKYCFQCRDFPCHNLKRLDKRYRTKYGMSMVDNLESIKAHGIRQFLSDEKVKWTCPECGGTICVHKGVCLTCCAATAKSKNNALYITSRTEWRTWLKKNHCKEQEVWLIYFKKHTGKPTLPYDDAVEEALCFGWIDSVVKRIDDEKHMQKFTPRKTGSIWAESNKRRVEKMIAQGRMTDAGMKVISDAKKDGSWSQLDSLDRLETPPNLETALKANKKAFENFMALPPSKKKAFIWWVLSAKRDVTRNKRINETVTLLSQNKMLPMM